MSCFRNITWNARNMKTILKKTEPSSILSSDVGCRGGVGGGGVKIMFSVFEGTNRKNLSYATFEYSNCTVICKRQQQVCSRSWDKIYRRGGPRKIPIFGMAYRDRLPQKLQLDFFYNPHVEVTARHRK